MTRDGAGHVARGVVDHPYRRILLAVLDGREPQATVTELAAAVLAYDRSGTDTTVLTGRALLDAGASDPSAVETMTAQLHHVHLPRLAAAGLLRYDADERVVTDWCHPPVGGRWLSAPPVERLASVIAETRADSTLAD